MTNRPRLALLARRGVATAGAFCLLAASVLAATPAHAAVDKFTGRSCIEVIQGQGVSAEPPRDIWWGDRLGFERLQKEGFDGTGVKIAVIDTGVDVVGNAWLSDVNVPIVEDFVPLEKQKNGNATDRFDCLHGTAVTGLIVGNPHARDAEKTPAQRQFDQAHPTALRGIAPGAKVYALRAMASSEASGDDKVPIEPVINAIRRAIELKVDVINISLTTNIPDQAYADAVKAALDAGIVVVAAAGNQGPQLSPYLPAAYPGVIGVGMTDKGDRVPAESGSSPQMSVSLGAPGVGLVTITPGSWKAKEQTYRYDSNGTSYAAPLVTGTVALMLQREPDLTPAQVRSRLMATADLPTATVPDPQLGQGLVNPWRALMEVPAPAPAASASPSPQPTAPSSTLGKPYVVEYHDPMARPRTIALIAAGACVGLFTLALLITRALPAARRRKFRAAE